MVNYGAAELIDLPALHALCESFSAFTNIAIGVIDLDGKVLVGTGWKRICTQFHRQNADTKKLCIESDTVLANQIAQGEKYVVYQCKNGLTDIAMPVLIENERICNFSVGQFFTEAPDVESFKKQAKRFGFDEEAYIAALHEVPLFHASQIRPLAAFLVQLTETIANSGLANLQIKEKEKQLQQSQKMDAIGQLAGGVAHDFNNQLTGIMGFAELLKSRLNEPQLIEYADCMLMSAHRSADLTRQLLAFSRKSEYLSRPTNVHAILQEVVVLLQHTVDKRIGIHQRLDALNTTVLADASQMQNAFLNIGINARDAMPDGGEIVLETRNRVLTAKDCAQQSNDLKPGKYIEVRMSDTGCGIPKEFQPRIFEPFFTTKERGKGSGMGLAATYGTVLQHGGAIDLFSEPGQGSSFVVLLPLTEQVPPKQEEIHADCSSLQGVRVLVIEDEEVVRDMMCEMLGPLGVSVHTESDGLAGITYFKEHWRDIDIVLLDMIMPRMPGRTALDEIRRIHPQAKVVISSGFSIGQETRDLLCEGAIGFMQKPFTRHDVTQAILKGIRA